MRRWLAVFLLVFLPLQTTWAVVTSYCQHESGAAALHLGHHEHQHHTSGDIDSTPPSGGIDGDCTACHLCCMTALTGTVRLSFVSLAFESNPWRPVALPSPPATVPERPDWIVSA